MSISLQRLRYFHTIASSGSFSSAARVLSVAQPALSNHIADIERELGTLLLSRSTRGVRLTDAGAILFRRADEILRSVESLEQEIRATVAVPHGDVTLALAVTMARPLVPQIFTIVNERFPKVRVKILDVGSVPAMDLMMKGRAEVALVPNAAELPDCAAEAVYTEQLCLISRSKGRRRRAAVEFDAIGDVPMVLPSRAYDLRRRVEEASVVAGHRLNVRYEQDSQEMIRAMVLAGLAATISQVAQFSPETERPLLDMRPIVSPGIVRTHAIVWRKDRTVTKAMAAVREVVREAIAHEVSARTFPGRYIPPPSGARSG